MSKTDKDRPHWVKRVDPTLSPRIEHDHRSGECIEETFESLKRSATSSDRMWRYRHPKRCPRCELVTTFCTPPNDVRPYCSAGRVYSWMRSQIPLTCLGHQKWEITKPDEPCISCDAPREPDPTCWFSYSPVSYHRYYSSSVPGWYRHHIWFDPERGRERLELDSIRKAYNAGEDIDDFDFPNYQHRSCGQWYWD